jgi:hypothetical protein
MMTYQSGRGSAIELESIDKGRQLLVLPGNLGVAQQPGLVVRALSRRDEPMAAIKEFHAAVKQKATLAADRIRLVETKARPGKRCATCDLGELCRKSQDFGEEDPFAF